METATKEAWEGVVHAKLPGATADQAWSLLKGFCSVHRLLPGVETCSMVDGAEGVPGCTRLCAGAPVPADGGGEPFVAWAREKLLSVDPAARSYTYEVTGSNMGFRRYVATITARAEEGGGGCTLEWAFAAEPVEGWTEDGLISYLQSSLEGMGKRIEAAVRSAA